MISEAEFREAARRRAIQTLSWLFLGIGAMLAWFGFVIAMDFTGGLFVIAAVPLFMGPMIVAEKKAEELSVPCPHCQQDLAKYSQTVIRTRRCRICDTRVLSSGRERAVAVHNRAQRIRQHRFLDYWFWAWPAFFAIVAIPTLFDPTWVRG